MRAPGCLQVLSIAAISFVLFGSVRAYAQNAAAESLFTDGERLLKDGRIAEACDAFEASNRVEPRAGTLINLGLCREQNGELASAWSAYKDALTRVKDPKKREVASSRAAALEPRLSYLTITVPDATRVDGLTIVRDGQPVDPAIWNRAVPMNGGTIAIAARAPGHDEWRTTIEVPKEHGKVSVTVPRLSGTPEQKPANIEVAVPRVATSLPITKRAEENPGRFTGTRKVALGLAVVGVGALAGGLVLGYQSRAYEDDAYALCPRPARPCPGAALATDEIQVAQQRALYANVSYGVGAAAVLTAGVLWFVGAPRQESRLALTPRVGGGTAALDLKVRF